MRRRPRRSESPPLRKTPSSPPRSIEDAVRKVTRKTVKEGLVDRGPEFMDPYEWKQTVAQTWYQVNEDDELRNFRQRNRGRDPTPRERAALERRAEERATQEFVEDERDMRHRLRGRGYISNKFEDLEPGRLPVDRADREEREELAGEPLPPPTSMGARIDRRRR